MADALNIAILTGSGISAESGLATFRDTKGIWAKYDYTEVATPEGFAKNQQLVHEFYNYRRAEVLKVTPNPAHEAIADLEEQLISMGGAFTLITQNVDDLHQRAGNERILPMHGEILKIRCTDCGTILECEEDIFPATSCSACGAGSSMRPDVVWFGEMPRFMDEIESVMEQADIFVSIGTSGSVYPAAGLVGIARQLGIETVELNLEPSENAHMFSQGRYGPASEIVPMWCEEVLAEMR